MKRDGSILSLCIIILIGFSFSLISLPQLSAGAEEIDVEEILAATAVYCERLENAVLYFVCKEEITSEPSITLISEFLVEKNGIRFPNYFFIEEAYIDMKGKKFIRSETKVTFKEFKFFTVEVDVKH